jgi:hypothetical protein
VSASRAFRKKQDGKQESPSAAGCPSRASGKGSVCCRSGRAAPANAGKMQAPGTPANGECVGVGAFSRRPQLFGSPCQRPRRPQRDGAGILEQRKNLCNRHPAPAGAAARVDRARMIPKDLPPARALWRAAEASAWRPVPSAARRGGSNAELRHACRAIDAFATCPRSRGGTRPVDPNPVPHAPGSAPSDGDVGEVGL